MGNLVCQLKNNRLRMVIIQYICVVLILRFFFFLSSSLFPLLPPPQISFLFSFPSECLYFGSYLQLLVDSGFSVTLSRLLGSLIPEGYFSFAGLLPSMKILVFL